MESPDLAPTHLWGIRLGMPVFVAASFEGFLMIDRAHTEWRPERQSGTAAIELVCPRGDLRIAHSIGLHAL